MYIHMHLEKDLGEGLLWVARQIRVALELFLDVVHHIVRDLRGQKKINRSHTHAYTPTENNTPDTHTRQEQHPKPQNEHPPQTLNNAVRWRQNTGGGQRVSSGGVTP